MQSDTHRKKHPHACGHTYTCWQHRQGTGGDACRQTQTLQQEHAHTGTHTGTHTYTRQRTQTGHRQDTSTHMWQRTHWQAHTAAHALARTRAASSAILMSTRSEPRKSARRLMADPREQPLRNSATSAGRCSWPCARARIGTRRGGRA